MNAFVGLYLKRNRGWPRPEDSWGLTPMFGEDGWCRPGGVPQRPQCGSLVLQRKGFTAVEGAWVPNWQFDAICMEKSVEQEAGGRFALDLRPVEWHGTPPGDAAQIVAPSVGEAWFDSDELREAAVARHGTAGANCADCGVWRWMRLAFGTLPALRISPSADEFAVAASPEWFGDGWNSYRQISSAETWRSSSSTRVRGISGSTRWPNPMLAAGAPLAFRRSPHSPVSSLNRSRHRTCANGCTSVSACGPLLGLQLRRHVCVYDPELQRASPHAPQQRASPASSGVVRLVSARPCRKGRECRSTRGHCAHTRAGQRIECCHA